MTTFMLSKLVANFSKPIEIDANYAEAYWEWAYVYERT